MLSQEQILEKRGKIAWDTYCKHIGGGNPVTIQAWEELTENKKAGWCRAADAVVREYSMTFRKRHHG
jgi:hypothetical protein